MLRVSQLIERKFVEALEKSFPEASAKALGSKTPVNPLLMPATKPEFGDFQSNCALPLSKQIQKSPRDIAKKIINELAKDDEFQLICKEPKIAGPGFINITIQPQVLINEIQSRLEDPHLGIPLIKRTKRKEDTNQVIIDFSSPNIAKEMHVGHLRSTIIGDSLARIFEFRGYSVLRLNHVGDWGTQFGMLITHLKEVAPKALKTADVIKIGDLVQFYRQAKKRFDEDEQFQSLSRDEVVKLQRGDCESLKAWSLLCDQSRKEFQQIYDRLDIRITERGESFYNKYLKGIVDDLDKKNILVTDTGAKCVFLRGVKGKDGNPMPTIVQKSDGGFNYATTDLAAIRYRYNSPPNGDGADRVIYVTDAGQANHFSSVFEIAKQANWIPTNCRIEHVPFGLVQGEDGKKLKTRSGETVKLKDLLNEAIERARNDLLSRLNDENRNESQKFINDVSTAVGIASVKYADLSQNRLTNYQFSFDRMLSLQGNTAPYLLYSLVRIAGINRKGGNFNNCFKDLVFNDPYEWGLIKELLKFDSIIIEVEEELLPNRLCNYLFELSQMFNRFYDKIPVLKAEEPSRTCRLALCKLTAETLQIGMNLLGLPTLERM